MSEAEVVFLHIPLPGQSRKTERARVVVPEPSFSIIEAQEENKKKRKREGEVAFPSFTLRYFPTSILPLSLLAL